MIAALCVLAPFSAACIWFFFRLSPQVENRKRVHLYNIIMMLCAFLFCVIFTTYVYRSMIETHDRAWWPVLSMLGALIIFPVTLVVGALLRNLLFFRNR